MASITQQMLRPSAGLRLGSRTGCRCNALYLGSRSSVQHQIRQPLSSIPAAACTPQPQQQQQFARIIPHAAPEGQGEGDVVYNKEFGYSRKDVLIIIVGLIGLGVVMYEGLQAAGMDAGIAGNVVQATIFLGICIGWVSTYLWRVANKKMTYARQLEMYESAVMQKRLEEMTEAELQQLMEEVESDKAKLAVQKEQLQRQQQRSSTQ